MSSTSSTPLPPPPQPPPTIFVTVGSTAFSPLIARILSPSILSLLPSNSKLVVQYGKSDLASILAGEEGLLASSSAESSSSQTAAAASTSAGFTQIDAGSELVPSAGLRKTQQGGYSWKGTARSALDPGRTGKIQGWELLDGREEDEEEQQRQQGQGGTQSGVRRRRGRRSSSSSRTDSRGEVGGSISSASSSDCSSVDDSAQEEVFLQRSSPARGHAGATFLTSPPTLNFKTSPPQSVSITLMAYVPSLTPHLKEANLVIAHAGAGTILETLRLPSSSVSTPPALLLVPNESLMDNHQLELAQAIHAGGWARCASLNSKSHNSSHSQGQGHKEPQTSQESGGEEFASLEEELRLLLAPWKAREQEGASQRGHNRSTSPSSRWQPRPFPRAEPDRFRRLVDEEMGYL
ncbi:hypothetical protein BCV69DRAFT_282429 [Microstroma glucosiphilum]|uniref:UDP-N-acetylglucosamine transferase subunit ALG13 n=1 Tax=Pseudomicrostroma glucosiphilum TaxID=1684307 RepID=A0A316U7V5_9BASI|nr:hypothetical protein BCV69DRAFT_282429 [Pseudomicrostroma glucosiphilum]PWN20918.1 hypothetical protein BCV69DRAFT_282429 [Pseudomicrostroma glucosiphilum]